MSIVDELSVVKSKRDGSLAAVVKVAKTAMPLILDFFSGLI